MRKLIHILPIIITFLSVQANSEEPAAINTVNECSDIITTLDFCSDVDALFNILRTSVNDSQKNAANNIMIPYKNTPCLMKLLLSARQTINGIAYTTPLHLVARGNNYGTAALVFQKASVLPDYDLFAREMANALDADGNKPIDYATNPQLISLLSYFTDP